MHAHTRYVIPALVLVALASLGIGGWYARKTASRSAPIVNQDVQGDSTSMARTPPPVRLVNQDVQIYTTVAGADVLVGTITFDKDARGTLKSVAGAPRAAELASAWVAALARESITYRGSGESRDGTHYSFGYTSKKTDANYSGALVRHVESLGFFAKFALPPGGP